LDTTNKRAMKAKREMPTIKKKDTKTTHRVHEHELLQRLERLCENAGLEFPKEAWPKDDHKAYFLLGVCATEDMKGLSLRE
jgi:putative IMPACT (imprinted ancient) family translation regulator